MHPDDRRRVLDEAERTRGVIIRVRDTGAGISAEHLPRVFDPFFTTKEVGEGTGLGLSIAFGIVKEHRGEITANSIPGEGTEFTIHLPLSTSSHR